MAIFGTCYRLADFLRATDFADFAFFAATFFLADFGPLLLAFDLAVALLLLLPKMLSQLSEYFLFAPMRVMVIVESRRLRVEVEAKMRRTNTYYMLSVSSSSKRRGTNSRSSF